MLQTIEVEIDASGHIRPLEPLSQMPIGRALLTLLAPDSLAPGQLPQGIKENGHFKPGEDVFNSLFGLLKANQSVSLEDMEIAIRQRASGAQDDRD